MTNMGRRAYGQLCGLAHALELVGERWALLIVRDLLVGPRRFTDLRRGLPRIPTNVLSTRLRELEHSGVVRRRVLPRPDGSIIYELTEYGRDLEDVVIRLGRWGARSMGEPGPEDVLTRDALITALRATFTPDPARRGKTRYEVRVGDFVVHAVASASSVTVEEGPLPDADLVIETGPAIGAVMAGELAPQQALASGAMVVTGKADLLAEFARTFRIGPRPVAST
jgi:DNA-binding HxlR family transcriptional regulator